MIGVFGGSGFYEFLEGARLEKVDTPYGAPAAAYAIGTIHDVDVVFLPRHGADHEFPPHLVPFRANVWGMKELGVRSIVGPCAAGSLQMEYAPGSFMVCDQLVDWTSGRARSFVEGPDVDHLAFADPYEPELRGLAVDALRNLGATVHDGGSVVVIQGPRFSTRAESSFFSRQGWSIVNMTQEPEVALSRELGIPYVNISVITDYDVGVAGEIPPVTHEVVLEWFGESLGTLRRAVFDMIPHIVTSACYRKESGE